MLGAGVRVAPRVEAYAQYYNLSESVSQSNYSAIADPGSASANRNNNGGPLPNYSGMKWAANNCYVNVGLAIIWAMQPTSAMLDKIKQLFPTVYQRLYRKRGARREVESEAAVLT